MKPPIKWFAVLGLGLNGALLIVSMRDSNWLAFVAYLNALTWAGFAIFMVRIAHKRSEMIDSYSKMVDSYYAMVVDLQSIIRNATENMKAKNAAREHGHKPPAS